MLITHKMVSRACKGRRLSSNVRMKILHALESASGKSYKLGDDDVVFNRPNSDTDNKNSASEPSCIGDGDPVAVKPKRRKRSRKQRKQHAVAMALIREQTDQHDKRDPTKARNTQDNCSPSLVVGDILPIKCFYEHEKYLFPINPDEDLTSAQRQIAKLPVVDKGLAVKISREMTDRIQKALYNER